MRNRISMYIKTIMRAMPLNKKMLPRAEYVNFAQTAIDFLKHEQRSIIISPSPYKNGFTFKFAFKTKGELVDVETLKPRDEDLPDALPDALAKRLFERNIKRIILSSGVKEQDLLDLISKIRVILPESLRDFDRPNIKIEYAEKGGNEKVHSLKTSSLQIKDKPQKQKMVPLEPKPAITPIPIKIEQMNPEELLSYGKKLRRAALRDGFSFSQKRRKEMNEWLGPASKTIEKYYRRTKYKTSKHDLRQRGTILELGDLALKFQRDLGLNIEEIKIPGDHSTKPSGRKETRKAGRPKGQRYKRPENNPFEELELFELEGKCNFVEHQIRSGYPNLAMFQDLGRWLRYILHANNMEREYGKTVTKNTKIIEAYRLIFSAAIKLIRQYTKF